MYLNPLSPDRYTHVPPTSMGMCLHVPHVAVGHVVYNWKIVWLWGHAANFMGVGQLQVVAMQHALDAWACWGGTSTSTHVPSPKPHLAKLHTWG